MAPVLSRREFLKLTALTAGGSILPPLDKRPLPEDDRVTALGQVRVTATQLNIRASPSFNAEKIGWRPKDHLFQVWDEVHSPDGPTHNPRWYRVVGGYIHSGYTQKVEVRLNPVESSVLPTGQLMEITVPFTQAWQPLENQRWQKLYRLYYGSVHWVTEMMDGPDNQPWYVITDDLLKIRYAVPAPHMRNIPAQELSPISSTIPANEKRIVVSLSNQTVTCYEADRAVFNAKVSTGLPQEKVPEGEISTETPPGNHLVDHKRPVRHMGDGEITSALDAYELPGVPWVSYFYSHTGVAFHGTYWHDNFGKPMSHGCVNMRNEDAKWLFRWTMPEYSLVDWYTMERGTLVQVLA